MIKLKTGSLLLHSVGGDFELFDLNELHDCLWECCLELGIDDQELPSDIINVVITFANGRDGLHESELARLIVRILMDSGLHTLAELFSEKRGTAPEFILDEQVNPTEESIRNILKSEPFFVAKPISQLSTMIVAQLEKLGFDRCGRNLILELARNSCSKLQTPYSSGKTDYWLIKRSEMPGLLAGEPLKLVTSGVFMVRSISSLLPSIHVSVPLNSLASLCGAGQLAELRFYPAFDEAVRQLPALRNQLQPEIEKRGSGISVNDLKTNVVFYGVKQLISDFALAQGNCGLLKQELNDIIRPALEDSGINWTLISN